MYLSVQLVPDRLTLPLTADPGAREVLAAAAEEGVVLRPVHAGVDDRLLAGHLAAEVSDPVTAQRLVARLQRMPAVAAAYLKPADALP